MMTHIEGPIVDSFYDACLISWNNKLEPPLPCMHSPAATGGIPAFAAESHTGMFDSKGVLRDLTGIDSRIVNSEPEAQPQQAVTDPRNDSPHQGGERNSTTAEAVIQNRAPQGSLEDNFEPRNLAQLAEAGNATTLPEHTAKDPHYDVDIAAETLRAQSVLSPRNGEPRMQAITRNLSKFMPSITMAEMLTVADTTIQPDTKGNAPECQPGDEMTTYIPLPAHELVPMAMVCRKPFGGM
jgi:hypothetical protein